MKDLFRLDNKVVVITGGLGQLGQQYSMALVNYGAKVAIIDNAAKTKNEISEFGKFIKQKKIKIFTGDILQKKQLREILLKIEKEWGTPEILINNAALDSPPSASADENGPFENYPEESLGKIVDVNLKGTFFCCQVFGGAMAKQKKGSILNIGSIYGMVSPNQDIYAYKRKSGQPWYKPAAYALTKSGIYNLTRYLAVYWAKQGVRVNTLTPAGIFNNQDKEFLAEYTKRIPIGRMANPDELNGAVIFLASDASAYMTGSNLVVDGGWTAW